MEYFYSRFNYHERLDLIFNKDRKRSKVGKYIYFWCFLKGSIEKAAF